MVKDNNTTKKLSIRNDNKYNTPDVYDELFNKYLQCHTKFNWFIRDYYGKIKVEKLVELAKNKDKSLMKELEKIWYELPDDRFNIINDPKGWGTFLDLLDKPY